MTQPLPDYSPCPWPVDPSCLIDEWESLQPEEQEQGIGFASAILNFLTGRRVGGCPVKVRPVHDTRACGVFYDGQGGWTPGINLQGQWVNNMGCASGCQHASCEVALPAPIGRVDEVKVNGSVIDPANYEIQNGLYLVWTGTGDCPWPAVQDTSRPDTEQGTFSVTYLNAYPVDRIGAHAAGTLALEFARACVNPNNCNLPSNVVSVIRQGVTYDIQPGLFPDGFTGIKTVDAFIEMWNPRGLKQDSSVWSPDVGHNRFTTIGGN